MNNEGDQGESMETHADSSGAKRDDTLRTVYWSVIHEHQKRLKREFPDMPAKEILAKARAEWFVCTYCLNQPIAAEPVFQCLTTDVC